MLCRFFSDNLYSLSSLANHYLWFSNLEDFNDPFETHIESTLYYEDFDKIDDSIAVKIMKSISKPASSINYEQELLKLAIMKPDIFQGLKVERLGVVRKIHEETYRKYYQRKWCCFSVYDEEFGEPIKRRLMWGHYANGLRGFVVEFDEYKLIESIQKLNQEKYVINATTTYRDLSRIDFYSDFLLKIKPDNEKLEGFLHQKAPEWRYETERRLGIKKQQGHYSPNAIRRVIIGEKMSKEFRNMLFIIINSTLPDIEVHEAYIEPESLVIKTRLLSSV